MSNHIPTKSTAFLTGLPILYKQFNAIDFYVEDESSENLYFEILKKLFGSTVRFEKIFPLNGFVNVVAEARRYRGVQTKIFLVDLDFSLFLQRKISLPNLFYLRRYSIENYFAESDAVLGFILEEKPRLKPSDVNAALNIDEYLDSCAKNAAALLSLYLIVQKFSLGLPNVKQGIEQFFRVRNNRIISTPQFAKYQNEVTQAMTATHPSIDFANEFAVCQNYFRGRKRFKRFAPGKSILILLKKKIEPAFGIRSTNPDSFAFRLAKNASFKDLEPVKRAITEYMS